MNPQDLIPLKDEVLGIFTIADYDCSIQALHSQCLSIRTTGHIDTAEAAVKTGLVESGGNPR